MPEAAICVQDIDVQCVLQFTLLHAAGCALHRHASRVIHRLELYRVSLSQTCDRFSIDWRSKDRKSTVVYRRKNGARGDRHSTADSLNRRFRRNAEALLDLEDRPSQVPRHASTEFVSSHRCRRPAVDTSALDAVRTHIVRIRSMRLDVTARHGNDPSAGSPTETLLRLLLPLDDQV